jgi:hypothetical protein
LKETLKVKETIKKMVEATETFKTRNGSKWTDLYFEAGEVISKRGCRHSTATCEYCEHFKVKWNELRKFWNKPEKYLDMEELMEQYKRDFHKQVLENIQIEAKQSEEKDNVRWTPIPEVSRMCFLLMGKISKIIDEPQQSVQSVPKDEGTAASAILQKADEKMEISDEPQQSVQSVPKDEGTAASAILQKADKKKKKKSSDEPPRMVLSVTIDEVTADFEKAKTELRLAEEALQKDFDLFKGLTFCVKDAFFEDLNMISALEPQVC